jgi:hypothetical protein
MGSIDSWRFESLCVDTFVPLIYGYDSGIHAVWFR